MRFGTCETKNLPNQRYEIENTHQKTKNLAKMRFGNRETKTVTQKTNAQALPETNSPTLSSQAATVPEDNTVIPVKQEPQLGSRSAERLTHRKPKS